MNVLIISHTYCAKINRDKWKVLSSNHDVRLIVVFPKVWPDIMFTHRVDDISEENSDNCKFIPLDAFKVGNEVLYGYYPRGLIKTLRESRPDIIHVEQGDNAFSYFQTILLSKLFCFRAKLVFFTWINWQVNFSLKYKVFWKWIEKINLKLSHGAIVGNKDAAVILKEKKFLKPAKVLPQLGVDTNFFTPGVKSGEFITFIFIGRLVKEKGIYTLVQAFDRVYEFNKKVKLVIVGDGPEKNRLKIFIAKFNSKDAIEILPSVLHEEVRELLQLSDVLVLPSYDTREWKEQFGHVLIEAMSTKVAVIGSDAGEIPNVIGSAGLVFKQNDIDSLAASMKVTLDKTRREKLIDAGYVRVVSKYSHKAIARETYEFWQNLIA